MNFSPDNPNLHAALRRLFGLLLVVLGLFMATSATAAGSAGEPCADEHSASAADDCEEQCPGELPDGECPDGCQHCGCCSSTASSLQPLVITLSSPATPARHATPQLSSRAPTGVLRGVFKPPRHLSA